MRRASHYGTRGVVVVSPKAHPLPSTDRERTRSVLTIGCSGALAPAGYSPLPEASPVGRCTSSGSFARRVAKAIWIVSSDDLLPSAPPVLAIVNARVWTNDPRRPWADGVLVREGRILAVGSSAELRKRTDAGARVVDARGLLLRPSHAGCALAPGSPASLELVEGAPAQSPAAGGTVVMELVDGHILSDRDGLSD